jgi:inner membrane protein
MFIGHLPAGYILTKLSYSRFSHCIKNDRTYLFWGILGSIAPDFDMFYFYLIDHHRRNHHKYISHYPVVWFVSIVMSIVLLKMTHKKHCLCMAIFSMSGFVHLILDSIAGDILWLAPFSSRAFSLATVPARYHPWWTNFMVHGSFVFEILVTMWAFWIWRNGLPVLKRIKTG